MAKYTELFIDYVRKGGTLPAIFEQITGFEEQFISNFADKEIGFETEDLFKLKLENKANIVIPFYKDKIAIYDSLIEKYKKLSGKTIIETTTNSRDIEHNFGATNENSETSGNNGAITSQNWDVPISGAIEDTPPQGISKQDAFTNTGTSKTTKDAYSNTDKDDFSQTFNHTEDLSNNEVAEQLRFITGQKQMIIQDCLSEFNTLFMLIW